MIAYRPDIDGLRALAVALVVIFHAKIGLVPGGFVGVDVFFVISGYLIASIIAHDLAEGKFSLAQFYARRARRILPALIVVVLASTIAAVCLIEFPQDLGVFAQSARAALLFYSNIFFSRTGGYFQAAAETQPLLHTWSLGVEEQFYLVAPLLLAPFIRSSRLRSWAIFGAVWVFFLWLSEHGVERSGVKAFYWPHVRAFELMIGVAIASPLMKPLSARLRGLASFAGAGFILLASVAFTSGTKFPGFAALLPTVGAALIIWSGQCGESLIGRVLSAPSLVFLGKISYPFYLWHWPIFVFAGFLPTPLDSPADRMALIVLALLCATATYYLVELPIRRRVRVGTTQRPFIFLATAGSVAALLVPLQLLVWSGGWKQRLGSEVARFIEENPTKLSTPGLCLGSDKWGDKFASNCLIGDVHAPAATFVLWGDSYGRMFGPAISQIAARRGLKGYLVSSGACEPLVLLDEKVLAKRKRCASSPERISALLKDPNITQIIVSGRWAAYYRPATNEKDAANFVLSEIPIAESLLETVDRLTAGHRKLTLIGPVPEPLVNVPLVMTRAYVQGRQDTVSVSLSAFKERNGDILKALADEDRHPGVQTIYPHLALCDDRSCAASEKGYALYVDGAHLSPRGVAKVDGLLSTIFDDTDAVAQFSP
jgi:peptidoglycan/LPS O-acetylase OafA/YrhL